MSSLPFDVCIRGSGITGLTLSLLLAKQRLRVGLVQSPPATTADVRAYALNPASRTLLTDLRVWPDAEHATDVKAMKVFGDQGGHLQWNADLHQVAYLASIVDVAALERELAQAVSYQPLIESLDAPCPAALTVICEGKDSASRHALGLQYNVMLYPQHAIAARLECEKPHEQTAWQWFSGSDHDAQILALLPLGGPQGRSVALVWSAPAHQSNDWLATEPSAFAEHLTQLSHHALGQLTLISKRYTWPLQRAQATAWVGPGFALVGDAAHTVHPLAGQGLNLGLADVATLASTLEQREHWRSLGDEKVLRRYERARKAQVGAMSWMTDSLQQLFAQNSPPWPWLRNFGLKGFDRSGPLKNWITRQAMGG